MRSEFRRVLLLGLALVLGLLLAAGEGVRGQDKKPNSAVKPVPREGGWVKRHESFVEIAKKGGVDVLFLGDSITDGWKGKGKDVWKERFEPLKAANFGIGGDRTQHVLWRITEGKELEGIQPRAAVLMIGTNNLGSNSNEEIVEGIAAIIKDLRRQRPTTRVLLLGIFPRGAKAADKNRDRIKEINKAIAKLDDDKYVRFLDIGDKFLAAEGELTKEIMPDALHLSEKGYAIWADAIKGPLAEMLKN